MIPQIHRKVLSCLVAAVLVFGAAIPSTAIAAGLDQQSTQQEQQSPTPTQPTQSTPAEQLTTDPAPEPLPQPVPEPSPSPAGQTEKSTPDDQSSLQLAQPTPIIPEQSTAAEAEAEARPTTNQQPTDADIKPKASYLTPLEVLGTGVQFKQNIPLTTTENPTGTVECNFEVLADGTVMIIGDGTSNGARAIALTASGELTIPNQVTYDGETYTVTQIGNYAFGGDSDLLSCKNITAVNFPDTLTRINKYAFFYCTAITSLVFPETVNYLGDYAFSRDSGVRTVTFEGNAPTVGSFVFTGGGVAIQKVIYHGRQLTNQKAQFNSTSSIPRYPTFFYTLNFYQSKTAMDTNQPPIGTAVISEQTTFNDIKASQNANLLASGALESGSIPALPASTNLWMFEGVSSYEAALDNSYNVYAFFSDYQNIATGTFSIGSRTYTGLPIPIQEVVVRDSLGLIPTYDIAYYRQASESAPWELTTDFTNPGIVKAVATGTGEYYGTIEARCTIVLTVGRPFYYPINCTLPDGTPSTILCLFSLTNAVTGTVVVSNNADGRAIDLGFAGSITIPQTITVLDQSFTTVGISVSAFGWLSSLDGRACNLKEVRIPATVNQIESSAFRACTGLQRVIFEGDASSTIFGSSVFYGAGNLDEVVYFGKRETVINLFTSNPKRYYTITFFDRKENVGTLGSIVGRMTLRDDVALAMVPSVHTYADGVFDGAPPAYPAWTTVQVSGMAEQVGQWGYHPDDENDDFASGFRSTLTDSIDAYAAQTSNDYILTDPILLGIKRDQTFEYTGNPVIDPAQLVVCAPTGGVLTLGTDYKAVFEREYIPGEWIPESDFINSGNLRVTVSGLKTEGIGKWIGSYTMPFKIIPPASSVGKVYKILVPLITPQGVETEVECQFKILTSAPNNYTMSVWGSTHYDDVNHRYDDRAVDINTAGKLIIPGKIRVLGTDYTVTTVAAQAFGATGTNPGMLCNKLTEVVLPNTLTSMGSYAFGCLTSLTTMTIHKGMTVGADRAFRFSGLKSVIFDDDVTNVPINYFENCSDLATVKLPERLVSIGNSAFLGCTSLKSIDLPATVSTVDDKAFEGCTALETLIFHEGTTKIGSRAFYNCRSITSLTLPQTLESIQSEAFFGINVKDLVIPAKIKTLGSSSFTSCMSLETITFNGDASIITYTNPFSGTVALKRVVFRNHIAPNATLLFGATVSFYVPVSFYDNEQSFNNNSTPLSTAFIKVGTPYASIDSLLSTVQPSALFEGIIPVYPASTNFWQFAGTPSMELPLTDMTKAYARHLDVFDLGDAKVSFSDGYLFTNMPVDPFISGTGKVITAAGKQLVRGTDYVTSFQRRDSNGVWQDSSDITSVGGVQVVITAAPGSAFHGQLLGQYTITSYRPGGYFTAVSAQGITVTYRVLTIGDEVTPGTVQIGRGYLENPAIANDIAGVVRFPASTQDPNGFPYTVTAVGDYALYRHMQVTAVILPPTINHVGAYAFAYARFITDTDTSNLQTVVFENNLETTTFSNSVFTGCTAMKTVIYGDKKGAFQDFGVPFTSLIRYYTVRFYDSSVSMAEGTLQAKVFLKEGAYVFSPSENQIYRGGVYDASDPFVDFISPGEGLQWRYEPYVLDEDQIVKDSLYAYARPDKDNSFIVNVPLQVDGLLTTVPCLFDVIYDLESEESTGNVRVGQGVEGQLAVNAATLGVISIPETVISPENVAYNVTEIAPFAFGATTVAGASKLLGVNLPNTLTTIGQGAFMNSPQLSNVNFAADSKLDSIGASAFAGVVSMSYIALPQSLTAIRTAAFERSGLTYIYIPFTVATLGQRAFDSCTALTEVVFGGQMSLNLPLVSTGQTRPVAGNKDAQPLNNKTRLTQLDNYVFNRCSSLERLVFDADVSELPVYAAFDGVTQLKTIVYGDKHNNISISGSNPQVYLTVSFFNSAAAQANYDRAAYIILKPQTLLFDHQAADRLTGYIPDLEVEHQWIFNFDQYGSIADSGKAYSSKIRYALDTSNLDAAFALTFTVDGQPVTSAAKDDLVNAVLKVTGAIQSTQLALKDRTTSQTLVNTTEKTAQFVMPGHEVGATITPELEMSLYTLSATGKLRFVNTMNYASMLEAASAKTKQYSSWDNYDNGAITFVGAAVPLTELFQQNGIDFRSGDTLIIERAGTTSKATISYDRLFGKPRNHYPGLLTANVEGSAAVEPALALTSTTKWVSMNDPDPSKEVVNPDMTAMYQLVYGQTAEDFYLHLDTRSGFTAQITKITVLSDSIKMDTSTYTQVSAQYAYTGLPIMPVPVIVDAEGQQLVKDIDYELEYVDNTQAGVGHVVASGLGAHSGKLDIPFRILRQHSLAGTNRNHTAALIAAEAYPEGSAGAIIACSDKFPDALSASALSGMMQYPVVLSDPTSLPSQTQDILAFLAAGQPSFQVIIIGSQSSVSKAVEDKLAGIYGKNSIVRLAGANRQETAREVYFFGTLHDRAWGDTCIVASGETFPDALSISPFAVFAKAPIFLSDGQTLSAGALKDIKGGGFKRVVVVGSSASVSNSVFQALQSAVGKDAVIRLGGSNRYETSTLIARWEISEAGMSAHGTGIATGINFPDALAGCALLGKNKSVLLLVSDSNNSTYTVLAENKEKVNLLRYFGDTKSVSSSLRQNAVAALNWNRSLF